MGRFPERHLVGLVLRQAQPVIIGLDRAVRFVSGSGTDRASPILVDLAGNRLVELIHPFPSDAEGDAGGRAQVTLVGGIDEYLSLVSLKAAGLPVQDDDFVDVTVRHRDPGRITVKLAHRPDLDAGAFRQHLVKDFRCDAGFEMITGRTIFYLLGLWPISIDIVRLDPVDKLEEQACRRAPGRDVGRPETVGRQAADVVRPF